MENFWQCSETLPEGVEGFSHFGSVHIFWLVAFVLLAVGCSVHYKQLSEKGRDIWKKTVAMLMVADEIFKHVGLLICGGWGPNYLPLHLCSINIFLTAYYSFRPNKVLGNFLYTVCLPGALAALLFPSWTDQPLLNFMHIHSFTVHILLALFPIVLTVGGEIRPEAKLIPKLIGILLVLAVIMYFLNPLLGSNFFFMADAGEGNPLYWFKVNWGNHLYGFPVLVGAVLIVMHGPVAIYRKLRKTKV